MMFSQNLTKLVSNGIKNSRHYHGNNKYWIKQINNLYYVGIKKKLIKFYENIDCISINNKYYVNKNEDLFYLESNNLVEPIYSPFDCKIIERNTDIMKNININPESVNDSWVVKIDPIIRVNYATVIIEDIETYLDFKKKCPIMLVNK